MVEYGEAFPLGDTARILCEQMRKSRDYSALAILADALEDDGFPDAAALAEMRTELPLRRAERAVALLYSGATQEAVYWMEGFAAELSSGSRAGRAYTYDELLGDADRFLATGEVNVNCGGDGDPYLAMDWASTLHARREEFWRNYELVTGQAGDPCEPGWGGVFFDCDC